MPSWIEKILTGILVKYLTPEVIAEFEKEAAVFVVGKLREFAKSTADTKIDDTIVDIIAEALGVP